MRTFLPAALLAATFVLTACGNDSGGKATDPADGSSASATPVSAPTVGSYSSFAPQDYTYVLRVTCFCAGSGDPLKVRVENGAVTDAVYTTRGVGHAPGEQADRFRWLTINDVIHAANDTGADHVEVAWPPGQDYPSSVRVDQSRTTRDEEVGYEVSAVVVD